MSNNFSKVIGNKLAISSLKNIINKDKYAPAYLFSGVSGIGKFEAAFIFACCLVACHTEILIIENFEGATSIKIEQMHEMISWCATKPIIGTRKTVIIDAKDGLSEKCSNALLKTLEAPPSGVTIIVVSNSEMLPTINSRCHHIPFNRLTSSEVSEVLNNLGHTNVNGAIIDAAQGSPGKALQIFNEWDNISTFVEDLSTLPNSITQALSISTTITKLEYQSQVVLLQVLTLVWWKQYNVALLGKATTAMTCLKAKLNPRAVWDTLLTTNQ
ncbi:DNA polymerase III, delta prime subunit (plasmid) [Calothrix sp. PCC 7716]|nr:DNA polymerase III, delta prime subunit [Calothrix sp. PCC 7716]